MILLIWMTAETERHAMISLQTMIYLDAKWMNSLFQSHKILTKKKKKKEEEERERKRKERERERERERFISYE